ncbi:HigA family addiction module antidote protein [Candidatus Acetothermia bacterium]|nr:HigA family addiction module antidote protein [Candidatus Acetothermia bacterium]
MMKRDLDKIPPVHPGEILREEFMAPLGLTAYRVAKDIGVLPPRINDLVNEKRAMTADTARRLGVYFRTGAEFWMNIQSRYLLDVARDQIEEEKLENDISPIPTEPKTGVLVGKHLRN